MYILHTLYQYVIYVYMYIYYICIHTHTHTKCDFRQMHNGSKPQFLPLQNGFDNDNTYFMETLWNKVCKVDSVWSLMKLQKMVASTVSQLHSSTMGALVRW